MTLVPLLIDGNNLMHALGKAGIQVDRTGLCRLLDELASAGERVRVVFDGPARSGSPSGQVEQARIDVAYSGRGSADDVILREIAADTAPRRLTVVSTDREIRRAARRRRCKLATSDEFVRFLLRMRRRADRPRPTEPPEKRRGLTTEQASLWLRELGLGEDGLRRGGRDDTTAE